MVLVAIIAILLGMLYCIFYDLRAHRYVSKNSAAVRREFNSLGYRLDVDVHSGKVAISFNGSVKSGYRDRSKWIGMGKFHRLLKRLESAKSNNFARDAINDMIGKKDDSPPAPPPAEWKIGGKS